MRDVSRDRVSGIGLLAYGDSVVNNVVPWYPARLNLRAQVVTPRRATATDFIGERNIECYLAWRSKWDRGYSAPDAMTMVKRFEMTGEMNAKRLQARRWLIERDRERIRQNSLSAKYPSARQVARIKFAKE